MVVNLTFDFTELVFSVCVFLIKKIIIAVKPEEEETEDLAEIKQRLESTIGSEELQQRINQARTKVSGSMSESGSIGDRRSLNGSLHRQQSSDSQSGSPLRSNSVAKEKEQALFKTGEKLIETEKSETGSVGIFIILCVFFRSSGH